MSLAWLRRRSVSRPGIASAILDVLAGVRSITEAALALGLTTVRFYAFAHAPA